MLLNAPSCAVSVASKTDGAASHVACLRRGIFHEPLPQHFLTDDAGSAQPGAVPQHTIHQNKTKRLCSATLFSFTPSRATQVFSAAARPPPRVAMRQVVCASAATCRRAGLQGGGGWQAAPSLPEERRECTRDAGGTGTAHLSLVDFGKQQPQNAFLRKFEREAAQCARLVTLSAQLKSPTSTRSSSPPSSPRDCCCT